MEETQTKVSQQDQDTIRFEIFTGLRNDRPIERFEHSDLAAGTNIDIDNSGGIARRAGYTQVAVGAAHSLWSDNVQCLLVQGGALKKSDAAYTLTSLRTLADANARVSYSKINDRVYFSNGTDTGIVEGGAARSWGLPVPPTPGVSVTVGNMGAGAYQFTMTYSRADGQESGAALAGRADVVDGSGLNFALPVSSDPSVVLKTLYISPPNSEVMYWALSAPNGQLTAQYANNALELNLPLLTQFLGPAPAGQLVGYYRGCMFVASGNVLYPSEPFAYELFDLRKNIQLDGRITMFAAMEDKDGSSSGLFLGTDKSHGILFGDSPEDFRYVPKADYGVVEGAMTYVDGALYGDNSAGVRPLPVWLTTQGICVGMPDMQIKNLTRTKFGFTAAGTGAALFMPGPNRLIFTSNF